MEGLHPWVGPETEMEHAQAVHGKDPTGERDGMTH